MAILPLGSLLAPTPDFIKYPLAAFTSTVILLLFFISHFYLDFRFLMTSLIATVVYPGDPAQPATGALAEKKLAENYREDLY